MRNARVIDAAKARMIIQLSARSAGIPAAGTDVPAWSIGGADGRPTRLLALT